MSDQRFRFRGLVFAFMLILAGPVASVAGSTPADGAPAQAPQDDVPETWVFDEESIDGETLVLDQRWRVLPGGRLVIRDSTVSFAAHPEGLVGIVVEPGGSLQVERSVIAATPGAEEGYALFLGGQATFVASRITGAAAVVAQPRSPTDLVDEAAGGATSVPLWRAARQVTAPRAVFEYTDIEARGAALIAGVPAVHRSDLETLLPIISVTGGSLTSHESSALECHATVQDPDLDDGRPLPLVADQHRQRLDLIATELHGGPGAATVHCPPQVSPPVAPARNLPMVDPALISAVNAALPEPPTAEAIPGPAEVRLAQVSVLGRLDAPAILADAATHFLVEDTTFDGSSHVLRMTSSAAAATVTNAVATNVAAAFETDAGTLHVVGGTFTGMGSGTGIDAAGGAASLDGMLVRAFGIGVAATTPVTMTGGRIENVQQAVVLAAPGTIDGLSVNAAGAGIALVATTGAEVRNSIFTATGWPLMVVSPDPEGTQAHFDHTVTGNTVDGRALAYVFDQNGVNDDQLTGHVVIAHSQDVRFGRLDPVPGGVQIIASEAVTLGAPIDAQEALLAALVPAAAPAFAHAHRDVRYVVYPGALKGPEGAEVQGTANDLDQAWLLVEDLREQGMTARFVSGQQQMPEEAYMSWTGVEDKFTALTMLGWSGSWPAQTVSVDRTWAEVQAAPEVWIELDPAFEQYEWVAPLADLSDAVGWNDFDQYSDYVDTITFGPNGIRNPDISMIVDEVQAGVAEAEAVLQANPGLTELEVVGGRVARPVDPALEPLRVPGARFQDVGLDDQWGIRIRAHDTNAAPLAGDIDFDGTAPLLYGSPIALTSLPADDAALARLENAGGIYEVDPSTIPMTTYLMVDDAPQDRDGKWLRPDGAKEIRAEPSHTRNLGAAMDLVVEVSLPGGPVVSSHTSPMRVGGTYSVVLDIGSSTWAEAAAAAADFDETAQRFVAGEPVDDTALAGGLHRMNGLLYHAQVNMASGGVARTLGVIEQPLVDVAITGQSLMPVQASGPSGVETRLQPAPPHIDVQGFQNAYAVDGDAEARRAYFFTSGIYSSLYEDHIFTQLHSLPAVSTIKILNGALADGQWLYQVDSANVDAVMADATLSPSVEQAIRDAVARGLRVVVHGEAYTYEDWTGFGWIEIDPVTGVSSWMISGLAQPALGTVLMGPPILNGGSGATWTPTRNDKSYWDAGYDDRELLDWGFIGMGAVLDYLKDGLPKRVVTTIAAQIDRTTVFAHIRYGSRSITYFEETVQTTIRITKHVEDPFHPAVRKIGKVGGPALTLLESGVDAYDVYFDPDDDRSMTTKTAEVAAKTGYNFAAAAVTGAAAAKGGAAGAAVCSLAPGAGTVVCGGIGFLGTAVVVGFGTSSLKKKIFG